MLYRQLVRRLGNQKWFAYTAAKLAPLDAAVLKRTKGRFGIMGNYGLPQCLLTTVGRKSGQKRTVTLLHGTDGDALLLVGSNFGQKHHPAWALNLEANPDCEVEIDGHRQAYRAHLVTDPEARETIWQAMYQIWPAYNAYRGRAGREIKLFELTRP